MKTLLLVLAGFIAGLVIVFWLQPSSNPSVEVFAAAVDPRAARETRLGELSPQVDVPAERAGGPRARENGSNELYPPFFDRARRDGAATPQQQRLAVDLIVAGFAPDRAEWINGRVQELRMEAQHEARREGRPLPADVEAATLRTELGDQDYERFLIARGVPTSVHIMRVLASSPADRAGMRQGDEIFYYDGKRVFNVQELNELTLDGPRGEPVVLDVRRDGQNFRLVLPRGPIGASGGGDLGGSPRSLER